MISVGQQIRRDVLVVAIAAFLGLVWAVTANVFWRQDFGVYDALVARTAVPASEDIVIVAIDDESILRLGRFPWDRTLHARMLDKLTDAGARAILYDVLFVEPGQGDAALGKSVKMAGPVLPLALEIPGRNGAEATAIEPLPSFHAPNVSIGHAEILPDRDGIIRSVHLVVLRDDRQWTHVAAITACRVRDAACRKAKERTSDGLFLIPFTESGPSFRSVPFSSVLDGGVPGELFKDRIVLVGSTAIGLGDIYATPLSPSRALTPGVEVNASVVQALVSGRDISPASGWLRFAIAFVPTGLLLAVFLFARPFATFLAAVLLAMATVAATVLFWRNGIWLSPVDGLAGIGVAYPAWAARRLQVATTFMRNELKQFRHEEAELPGRMTEASQSAGRDMDDLHQAISRSRNFRNFLRLTLNGLPDASFVMTQDGIVMIQNAAAEVLLGRLEGEHFSKILALFPGGHELVDRFVPTGHNAFPEQLFDASGRVYNIRWSHIHDQPGDVTSWILRLADVTELHRATIQREEALQLLTHDMRSPQISILALLDQQTGGRDDEVLNRIRHYAGRTLAMADGFVQLARAETIKLSVEEIDLSEIVFDAVDDLWPLARKKDIVLKAHGCDRSVVIQGDRQLLTRALINIIDNAIKFTLAGTDVDCRLNVTGKNVSISVCDRGPGVEDNFVGKLFSRFLRGAISQTEGAGLGLAFVRSVAQRHRGAIAYSARSGGGSCFNLTLPLTEPPLKLSGDP
jgi:CHASE2 domain-containing sensor protein/signal transduction histidine kinase